MKRTFPANIDGQIFYIDEDAFELLNNYLEQLRLTFRGTEGAEIVCDIESRIRELFNERIEAGAGVIVLTDVNMVIETMGRPEDLTSDNETGSTTGTTPPPPPSNQSFLNFNLPGNKKLFRNMQNKVFGGVFGGLGAFLGWNASIMRILYILVFFLLIKWFWLPTIVYLLCWMIIPPALTPRQVLEMNGDPLNVGTLGQAVIANSTPTPPPYSEGSFWTTALGIVGKCLMAILGVFSTIAFLFSTIFFVVLCAGALAYGFNGSDTILSGLDIDEFTNLWAGIWAILSSLALVALVSGSITCGASSVLFRTPSLSRTNVLVIVILSVMLLFTAIFFFAMVNVL